MSPYLAFHIKTHLSLLHLSQSEALILDIFFSFIVMFFFFFHLVVFYDLSFPLLCNLILSIVICSSSIIFYTKTHPHLHTHRDVYMCIWFISNHVSNIQINSTNSVKSSTTHGNLPRFPLCYFVMTSSILEKPHLLILPADLRPPEAETTNSFRLASCIAK